jgi:SAM-dependent methyltransferase
MHRWRWVLIVVMVITPVACARRAPPDQEQVWRGFLTWLESAPLDADPVRAYLAQLRREGASPTEVERQSAVITDLMSERPEAVELFFDRVYAEPVSGDSAQGGFSTEPSAVLAEAVRGVTPGTALDVGMGQGRNAVFLAQQGWDVTGFDISSEALRAARANAEHAGVPLRTVKASYETFEFGDQQWDLIVLAFAWAPVSDSTFVARLYAGLEPGGIVVFEHFIDDPAHPYAEAVHALRPNQLRVFFREFRIDRYEEIPGTGDWRGRGAGLVRMVARRP